MNHSADLPANCQLQYDKRTVTHLPVTLIVIVMLEFLGVCVCMTFGIMYTLLFVELELRTGMGNLGSSHQGTVLVWRPLQ